MSGRSQTNWLTGYNGRVERDVPLAPLTWFNLGGPARYMASPRSVEELGEIVRRARENAIPVKVLGGGANVLVRDDGVDGLVVRLDDPCFEELQFSEQSVDAGAGVDLMQLSFSCARKGLVGPEGLAGIPGTVGGGVRMNAGGKYGELGDLIEHVHTLDRDGHPENLTRDEVGFRYRGTDLGERVVISVRLRVTAGRPDDVVSRFRDIWAEKKRSQPLAARSAGCVFKNPPGRSAGALIDQCGLKGMSCGGTSVSHAHANFFVTQPGATAADMIELIDSVRDIVRREFGVELETEIDIW